MGRGILPLIIKHMFSMYIM